MNYLQILAIMYDSNLTMKHSIKISNKDIGKIKSPLDNLQMSGGKMIKDEKIYSERCLPVGCLSASVLAQAGTQTGICEPRLDI